MRRNAESDAATEQSPRAAGRRCCARMLCPEVVRPAAPCAHAERLISATLVGLSSRLRSVGRRGRPPDGTHSLAVKKGEVSTSKGRYLWYLTPPGRLLKEKLMKRIRGRLLWLVGSGRHRQRLAASCHSHKRPQLFDRRSVGCASRHGPGACTAAREPCPAGSCAPRSGSRRRRRYGRAHTECAQSDAPLGSRCGGRAVHASVRGWHGGCLCGE